MNPTRKTVREQITEQAAGRCVHFNGIQHGSCRAGINYLDVRDSSGTGPYRWPCIDNVRPCGTTCDKRRMPTAAEIDAEVAEVEAAFARQDAQSAAGLCDCGAKIDRAEQKGSCMYARPCGHRIGQGDAGEYNRARQAS